jgi:hypothetical protein
MTKIFIRSIRLGQWFPAADPLAASIARLVILREDFMLEGRGIRARNIPELDEHSDSWRQVYFFRNIIRTLWEIQGALTTIRMNAEFKRIFKKQSQRQQDELRHMSAKLNGAASIVRSLRDALGGHVLPESVAKAIDNMPYGKWGFLEVGRTIGATHFKIAMQLVEEMFVAGVPENQKRSKMENDIKALADLLPVVDRLEKVIVMYAVARGLI